VTALAVQWAQNLVTSKFGKCDLAPRKKKSRDMLTFGWLRREFKCRKLEVRSVEKSWDSISEVEWVRPGSELLVCDQVYVFEIVRSLLHT
jgi:hypothetical protein